MICTVHEGGEILLDYERVTIRHLKPQLRDSLSSAETMTCHSMEPASVEEELKKQVTEYTISPDGLT